MGMGGQGDDDQAALAAYWLKEWAKEMPKDPEAGEREFSDSRDREEAQARHQAELLAWARRKPQPFKKTK